MAIIAPSSGITLCLNRLRRTIGDDLSRSLFSFRGQLRGKKKLAKKTTTIKVRLLKDVPGFGRKGAFSGLVMRQFLTFADRHDYSYRTRSNEKLVVPATTSRIRDCCISSRSQAAISGRRERFHLRHPAEGRQRSQSGPARTHRGPN